MTQVLVLLFLSFFLFGTVRPSLAAYPFDFSLRIDCGGQSNFTNEFNQTWIADKYYTGGSSALVSNPQNFVQVQERTLRFFPISFGKKNCYNVDVPNGRYFIRMLTVYDNYDSEMHSPSFDVSVEGTLVFSWRSPWAEDVSKNGAYSDVFAYVNDGQATICFYSIATDAPVIASLAIVQVDPLSYDSYSSGRDMILVNYGRLTCGSNAFGPGFSKDIDYFGRAWQSDSLFRGVNAEVRMISTTTMIHGTDQAHDYFPQHLYQTAITATLKSSIEYQLTVDARLDYYIWFHFAEIDQSVVAPGQRVFDININERNVSRIDIFKEVGAFTALRWHYTLQSLNNTQLRISLVPVVGDPLICGLENYAMVPLDFSTDHSQVAIMEALKGSLRVPDRMGWNGDPCSPSSWDTWEGVTCQNKDNNLVITHLDLGSQGLKGYVHDQISLLTSLVSLNLSFNDLTGSLPQGLGAGSLIQVDLSSNRLTGSIPYSFGSSNLQTVLLNNNELEGQVPEALYSIGVHGGIIDLSHNKGLCGVPSLPDCPSFWGTNNLPTAAKVSIGLGVVVFLLLILLIIYFVCIRRGNNDYDFGLPQDLHSMAAKRNRYQRQKSLMLLELETQNVNGFSSNFAPLQPFTPDQKH